MQLALVQEPAVGSGAQAILRLLGAAVQLRGVPPVRDLVRIGEASAARMGIGLGPLDLEDLEAMFPADGIVGGQGNLVMLPPATFSPWLNQSWL